jgi:hypothetical protein
MLAFTLAQSSPPETLAKLPGFLGSRSRPKIGDPLVESWDFHWISWVSDFNAQVGGFRGVQSWIHQTQSQMRQLKHRQVQLRKSIRQLLEASGIATFLTEEK